MILDRLIPILLLAALLLAAIGMLRRARLWRAGRPDKVDLLRGLMAMPRRYLVDLHHVVERDKVMSKTHVATAGGFVLSMILLLAHYVTGVGGGFINLLLAAALVLRFPGAVLVYKRRRRPPPRLSKGPWMRLPKSLLAFAGTFFITTLPLSTLVPNQAGQWLLSALLVAGIVWGLSLIHISEPTRPAA